MADRRRNTSGYAQTNDQNSGEERDLDVEPSNGTPSRDRSQHTSGRSGTTPVPHSSVQSHTPMEVDIRNRNRVQPHTNSSSGSDSQLATGPTFNVVDNKGPTQVGEGSTVVYNITNNHNHNHYHCPLHPSHHHGDSSTYHAPDHCPKCLHYHHSDHPPFCQHNSNHQESESQHLRLPHHPVPRLLPSLQQTEHTESTESRGNGMQRTQPQTTQGQPENQIIGQRSTPSQQSSPSDVKNYVHGSAREETSDARAANCKAGARKKEGKSKTTRKVSESARMRPVSGDDVADTLSILDTEGQKLLPGDAVWFSGGSGIYIGSQMVVTREESLMVKKMKLNLTQPFQKMSVTRGECQVFPPRQRVDRATAMIGREFEEGEWWYGRDFTTWVFTGLGLFEAWMKKGFGLD